MLFRSDLYADRWNHYQDQKNHYKAGDHRRTETISIKPNKTDIYTKGTKTQGEGDSWTTSANGYHIYSEDEVDSLNIDLKQDVKFNSPPDKDWDLNLPDAYSLISDLRNNDGFNSKSSPAALMRIHTMIDFDTAHKKRSDESRAKSSIDRKSVV